jgi:hypothetical protein
MGGMDFSHLPSGYLPPGTPNVRPKGGGDQLRKNKAKNKAKRKQAKASRRKKKK